MAQADPFGPYTSKKLTSSGTVTTAGVGGFVAGFGMTVTTNASECELFDGTASGTLLMDLHMDGATAKKAQTASIGPVRFDTDVYCKLTGTGAEAWVVYVEDPS